MVYNAVMPVLHALAPVLENYEVGPGRRVIVVHAPEIAALSKPGHFINVLASESYEHLLRKPFSIYRADPRSGRLSMLYQMKGATTAAMSSMRSGEDAIDIIGPLGGRVFEIDPRPGVRRVMAGGGYGVPPLVFLTQRMRSEGFSGEIIAVVGARTKDLLDCVDDFKALDARVVCSTDDGSFGVRGKITDALEQIVTTDSYVYCCGPNPMMKAVGELAARKGAPCQVSLEVSMACGVGVCMGCVVDLTDGKRVRACIEGPVFEYGKARWE